MKLALRVFSVSLVRMVTPGEWALPLGAPDGVAVARIVCTLMSGPAAERVQRRQPLRKNGERSAN